MPPTRSTDAPPSPGILDYWKHAFLHHWNLLLFGGSAMVAALSPWPDALLPIVGGLELGYLTALSGIPKFRTAVAARMAAKARSKRGDQAPATAARESLANMLESLPAPELRRFSELRQRCSEMRDIASGVRGQTQGTADSADAVRTPALDRLLFLFLKLLMTKAALERFLKTTSEPELNTRLEDMRTRLNAAQSSGDERVIRSLQDSVADADLRLSNYRKSVKDAEFVAIELDRIETKIQALVEMGVSRQDPDSLSHQVTAAADSMRQTEETVNQLQHLTGMADHLQDPPPILESDIGRMLTHER
ncbi:MAG: hypothetical protein WEE89_14810 [Gemmatimonadota bacterium]